jgi:hypothetical protein
LINVITRKQGKVSGYWIQDHVGTIETAKERAKQTNSANGNRLTIAVVDEIPFQNPLNYIKEFSPRFILNQNDKIRKEQHGETSSATPKM